MERIKRTDIPDNLSKVYFDFHWSQKKLWSLDLPTTQKEITELIWIFQYPVWASDPPKRIFDLRPIDVLNRLEDFPKSKAKLLKLDSSFPIHIMHWNDRWATLDGIHRLLLAFINLESAIKVKIVPPSAITAIMPDSTNPCGYGSTPLFRTNFLGYNIINSYLIF